MVRRWSYINKLNTCSSLNFPSVEQGSFDATIHATMYLRKVYKPSTVLTRRKWARRKHYYIWTPQMNILKDWARTYRFNRNHFKSVFNQFFTKNSFLAFNLLSAKNLTPSLSTDSGAVIGGSLTKKVINYYNSRYLTRFYPLLGLKNANLFLSSWESTIDSMVNITKGDFVVPLLGDNIGFFTNVDQENVVPHSSLLVCTFDYLFRSFTSSLVSIYRVLVLLTLKQVRLM